MAAVVADIAPPIIDPAVGMSFSSPDTIALPAKLAPTTPAAEVTIVEINAELSSIPNVLLIPAIIPICMGANTIASENGIGVAPAVAAAVAAPIIHLLTAFFLSSLLAF